MLIEENLFQKEFVEQNVEGFEKFKEHVKDKTPEWAFIETGLEPNVIRETARELAKNAPAAFVHPGRHVVWYGNDTQRTRAIAIVNALLGNWGKKGGFYLPQSMSIPGFPGPAAARRDVQAAHHLPAGRAALRVRRARRPR